MQQSVQASVCAFHFLHQVQFGGFPTQLMELTDLGSGEYASEDEMWNAAISPAPAQGSWAKRQREDNALETPTSVPRLGKPRR